VSNVNFYKNNGDMRKKYILRALFVFVLIVGSRFISSNNELPQNKDFEINFKLGMEYVEGELYEEAVEVFMELLAIDEFNANVNYLLGYCYYNIPAQRSAAIPYFENALNDIGGDYRPNDYTEVRAPAIAYYYLAEVYFINNDFNEAISNYENLRLLLDYAEVNLIVFSKSDLIALIDKRMENCDTGISLSEDPVNIDFIDMPILNQTEFSSYSGMMYSGIWYTKREIEESSKSTGDIFTLTRKDDEWQKVEKPGGDINSSADDLFCDLAFQEQLMLISSNRGERGDFDIYYSRKKGKKWSEPQSNLNINSTSNETFATYSLDGNTIYFVSDRKGGVGGKDIYMSEKLSDGLWGEAQNMGEMINSEFNEESPYLSDDGKTLYFSSTGHENMGGYDIFYSKFENNNWTKPQNIGYPINTTLDDLYFSRDSNNICLYSSGRRDAPGSFYLFMFNYPEALVADVQAEQVLNEEIIIEEEVTEANEEVAVAVAAAEGNQFENDSLQAEVEVQEPEINTSTSAETDGLEEVAVAVAVAEGSQFENDSLQPEEEVQGAEISTSNSMETDEEVVVAVAVAEGSQVEDDSQQVEEEIKEPEEEVIIVEEVIELNEVTEANETVVEEVVSNQSTEENITQPTNIPESNQGEYYYTVQIGAGNMKVQYFDKIAEKTVCFSADGLARFYVGAFTTLSEAVGYRDELIMLGYSDAWTPKIDAVRCKDFDLNYLLNLPDQDPSRHVSTGRYTVQVGAGNMKISHFKKLQKVKVCKGVDGLNRFIIGRFDEIHEAEKVRSGVVNLGYYDAWIPEIDQNRCGN